MKKILVVAVLAASCAWLSRPSRAVEPDGCSACEVAAAMLVPETGGFQPAPPQACPVR